MRKFDFYEFAGVIVPGTVFLLGAAFCSPPIKQAVFEQNLSIGKSAISLIAAYGLGHLIAALGNLIEWVLWRLCGGWPTDWPRSGKHDLVSPKQISSVNAALKTRLALEFSGGFQQLSESDWFGVVRQVYADVAATPAVQRVDTFNGNYGLNRGLAAALLALSLLVVLTHGFALWELLLVSGAAVAVYRMHRFARHYARELFVQFLQRSASSGNTTGDEK